MAWPTKETITKQQRMFALYTTRTHKFTKPTEPNKQLQKHNMTFNILHVRHYITNGTGRG